MAMLVFLGVMSLQITCSPRAEGQGVRRADPCLVVRIEFKRSALPRGASIAYVPETPTIEAPFRQLAVLVNSSAEPLYLAVETAPASSSDRAGSGLPAAYQPFFKLAGGAVYEWRQDASREIGRDKRLGHPVYAWGWQPIGATHHLRRGIGRRTGLALIPDATAFLRTDGGPVDVSSGCSAPEPPPRRVVLSAVRGTKLVVINGTARYARAVR